MKLLKEYKAPLIICGLFVVLGTLRLNDLSLYTDSTRYLIWGTSVGHLKGFIDNTQPEADRYVVNAPLYAVVLAPAMAFFPMSIVAAKVWTLLWGACVVLLFYFWLSRMFNDVTAALAAFVLALNPLFLVISTEVLSEAPFLALLFLIFLLFEKILEEENPPRGLLIPFLLSVSLSVLLREVAITLVGALFFTMIFRRKGRYAFLMIACVAAAYALWMFRNLVLVGETPSAQSSNVNFILQHALTPPDGPFHEEVWARIRSNAGGFGIQLAGMLFYPILPNLVIDPGDVFRSIANSFVWGKFVIIAAAIPVMVSGIVLDLKKSPSALLRLLFLLFYFAVILTYPIHDVRFLLPALPFMIFYAARTLFWLSEKITFVKGMSLSKTGFTVLLVALLPNLAGNVEILRTNLSYRASPASFYELTKATSPEKTYFAASWAAVGAWIQEHTDDKSVIASSSKEPATFVGNRKILEMNSGIPLPTFEFMLRDYHVQYLMTNTLWADFQSYEFLMRESQRFLFQEAGTIGNVSVYKVRSRYREDASVPSGNLMHDTSATGWLRKGRSELVVEHYEEAIRCLERASELRPNQPEPIFQLFLANVLIGDSARAIQHLRRMFTTTRSTPYVWAAQSHLSAMQHLNMAKNLQSAAQKSVALFDVGRFYWNLGYRKAAYRTMRESVRIDPSYFVGLLWAWHFGIQTGDTLNARNYLRTLSGIDRNNGVVKSFTAMTAFADTLRRTRVAPERSRLRMMIALEYDKMELPEEAIDETERAIGEDPGNVRAWSSLGQLFNRKKKRRAAEQAYQQLMTLHPGNAEATAFFSRAQ